MENQLVSTPNNRAGHNSQSLTRAWRAGQGLTITQYRVVGTGLIEPSVNVPGTNRVDHARLGAHSPRIDQSCAAYSGLSVIRWQRAKVLALLGFWVIGCCMID